MTATMKFVIEGAWITERARGLVSEDRLDSALSLLGCVTGLTADQQMDILNGRARLEGDSEVGITLKEEPDAASKPKFDGLITQAIKRLRAQRDQALEEANWAQQLAGGLVVQVGSPTGRRLIPISASNEKRNGLREDLVWDDADVKPAGSREFKSYIEDPIEIETEFSVQRRIDLANAKLREAINTFMEKDEDEDEDEPEKPSIPQPQSKCGESGWLSPDGKFYPCPYWIHEQLAQDIVTLFKLKGERQYDRGSVVLEHLGWVKFGVSMLTDGQHILGFLDGKSRPTKIQKTMTLDFCLEKKQHIPDWAKD